MGRRVVLVPLSSHPFVILQMWKNKYVTHNMHFQNGVRVIGGQVWHQTSSECPTEVARQYGIYLCTAAVPHRGLSHLNEIYNNIIRKVITYIDLTYHLFPDFSSQISNYLNGYQSLLVSCIHLT